MGLLNPKVTETTKITSVLTRKESEGWVGLRKKKKENILQEEPVNSQCHKLNCSYKSFNK